jgi:small subunit ribosomal protein S2
MKAITLEELLEAGCHFGHQVTRQNPKAREFIFEARDNIHIIDLGKTKEGLEEAAAFLLKLAQDPESTLLVVGTKRQAVSIIEEELARVKEVAKEKPLGLFSVTKRWMGGTLTNTQAISRNYARLNELTDSINSEDWKQKYTKRELVLFEKERQKYETYYGGIVNMKKMPSALFVVDTHTEDLAVREGNRMKIPVVGIVDTNADPDLIDYVIPANDDAVGSLKLLISYILDAWTEGKMKPVEESAPIVKKVEAPAPVIAPSPASGGSNAKQSDKKKSSKEESQTSLTTPTSQKKPAKKSAAKKEKKG